MLLSWVIVAPMLVHLSRNKWLTSMCSDGSAWMAIHRWGAFGVCLTAGVSLLLAIIDFNIATGHLMHTVGLDFPANSAAVVRLQLILLPPNILSI